MPLIGNARARFLYLTEDALSLVLQFTSAFVRDRTYARLVNRTAADISRLSVGVAGKIIGGDCV